MKMVKGIYMMLTNIKLGGVNYRPPGVCASLCPIFTLYGKATFCTASAGSRLFFMSAPFLLVALDILSGANGLNA